MTKLWCVEFVNDKQADEYFKSLKDLMLSGIGEDEIQNIYSCYWYQEEVVEYFDE